MMAICGFCGKAHDDPRLFIREGEAKGETVCPKCLVALSVPIAELQNNFLQNEQELYSLKVISERFTGEFARTARGYIPDLQKQRVFLGRVLQWHRLEVPRYLFQALDDERGEDLAEVAK